MRARRSILLAAALAALLLVTGVSAFAIWWTAKNSRERVARLQNAHMRAGVALGAIRANVYLNAILTRDYLLDSDWSHAQQYIDQFNRIQTNTDESFNTLETLGPDNEQKTALARLRRELAEYWDPTEVVLDWSEAEKRAQRAEMLRQRVRRREEIFALADEAERLMTANFDKERQRITTEDREFNVSLGWTTGIALLLGFAIAGSTLARMLALERQSQKAEAELRLLSGQLRTAQEDERKLLSRELHDQVGQMLTGLRMELASITPIPADPSDPVSARLARARGTVEQTLRIVRNIAMLLRPSMLDDLGLTPALAWLMKEFERSHGLVIRPRIDPSVDSLPDAWRTCIFRIVQEALTNASRHSGAHEVSVTLTGIGGWVTGVIADAGRGFRRTALTAGGMGLLGMEERVRELGGSIQIQSAPGAGTRVEFSLPRPGPAEVINDQDPDCGRSRNRADRIETTA